jgi:hypothetical protein
MRLTPGTDYDPERVRRMRATIRWLTITTMWRGMSREAKIRTMRDLALAATEKPRPQPYRIMEPWHPVRAPRDERLPEEMLPEADVRAWQRREFARTGLRYPVAACLAWLEAEYGAR